MKGISLILILLTLTVYSVNHVCGVPSPFYSPGFDNSSVSHIYTDVIQQNSFYPEEDEVLLTLVSFKTLSHQKNLNSQNACWSCSSPCIGIRCCAGSYPQCCVVRGRCGCCRRATR